MTTTLTSANTTTQPNGPVGGRRLRAALLAVMGVGLLLLGGGLAVALGIGRDAPPTAESVDVGFARDMSAHHLQGVEMANLAPERSTDDAVRRLAFDIAETQQNQAGRMQGWLALWGYSPTGGEQMAWMGDSSDMNMDMGSGDSMTTDTGLMPGMATDEQLAQLRSVSGKQFDVLFLQLMIRHHQGALPMAQFAEQKAETPAVRSLARAVARSQTAEVEFMTRMLAERGAQPLPAP